ncbi:MAG: DEAD/DEAH box helicase [Acidimicrobiia bacterium]
MTTFQDLGVPARLSTDLARRGITAPFPIQRSAIPDLLAGRDVLGRAPTGSGKTLAFGLPLMARVERAEPRHPRALVLAPTRELAHQIGGELTPLGKAIGRWVATIYGGVGYDAQRRRLQRGVDVLVATPGRLIDLLDQGSLFLDGVSIAVIDEADRMADMGFLPQVRRLLDQTPASRQTVLFSATLDGDVAELTRRYQTDPVRHEVSGGDRHADATHYFWQVEHHDRVRTTAEIVDSTSPSIVFTRTRHGADRVADQLDRAGVSAAAIHGGRNQNQRTRALGAFTSGRVKALVATDVAARGIHVDGIASVVHFDLAADAKDYLHRSGRTARAGAGGVVVTLVLGDQLGKTRSLQRSVGLRDRLHRPADDWLTGVQGGRIGEVGVTDWRRR